MRSFIKEQNKLICKIKYYANRLLFPISFIDNFKSQIPIYNNINVYDAVKIYNYLNEYNSFILKSRDYMNKVKKMTKWGFLNNSYILLKIECEYLIRMIKVYANLILKFIQVGKKIKYVTFIILII